MAVTFVHTADLHLGSPLQALAGASESMARRLARATEEAFARTVSVAIDRDVDFVVVAGDLYDREARSVRATEFLADQFGRLEAADIPSYVVHGNHDPLGQGAGSLPLPESVHVFGADAVSSVPFPDVDDPRAELLGRSYRRRHEGTAFVDEYAPSIEGVPSIGLLHTGLTPDDRRYVPCGPGDLADRDLAYWALGHVHHPGRVEGAPAAYPGIPQPRHVGEPPVGGCLVVDLAAGADPTLEFVPTGPVRWRTVTVDVAELEDGDRSIANLTDLETALFETALGLPAEDPATLCEHDLSVATPDAGPAGTICRIRLEGRGTTHELLADEEARSYLTGELRDRLGEDEPFVWVETIRDRTAPPLPDRETLAAEDEVIAAFLELVEDLREDPAVREELREVAGGAWEWAEDPDRETTAVDRIPLTDRRLDRLIDEATDVAVTELADSRRHAD